MSKRRLAAALALVVALAGVLVLSTPYDPALLDPSAGGPLLIEDRNGVLLRSVPSSDGRPGREAWVPLSAIAAHAVLAVVASEDQRFFEHDGVDAVAVARALWLNLQSIAAGRAHRYGASTISMQLARMTASPGQPRTLWNKLRESALALRIERALDKPAILEQYLNRAYYGRGAYGIEAAARRYFGKPAASLSAGEATLLAILPRSPGAYDPIGRLPRALERREHVLGLLVEQNKLTAEERARVLAEPLAPELRAVASRAPHFVEHVLAELVEPGRGGRVRTTLDAELQALLERRVAEHVESLAKSGVTQAGVVVLDTQRGEVLAMVGSAGYEKPEGQLNIATWRRYPGSSLKPFVYGAAIEHGASPATLAYDVYDVPSRYRVRDIPPREHGPARYREALAGSYNLAAVHVLERVGEARVLEHLRRAGVFELPGQAHDYGLRLALGNTKVRLLDLASAYGAFARAGSVVAPRTLLERKAHDGINAKVPVARDSRVFSPETSALVLDMLADAHARTKVFGQELPTDLPYPVAVKTGTARGFADNVAVFLTRELTVAAWSGRFDGKATRGMRGMDGAAPLARAALLAASRGRPLTLPEPPATLSERAVCPLSGMLPGPACPARFDELFAPGTEPKATCTFHEHHDGQPRVVYPADLRGWAKRHGAQTHSGS
jgi:penicillin-binding protein 1C